MVEALSVGDAPASAYPHAPLQLVPGRFDRRELPCVALENEFLKVIVAPTLGGRVLSLLHKPSGIDAFDQELMPSAGGLRGVKLDVGLEFTAGEGDRLNAMGPVLIQPDESGAALQWFELSGQTLSLAVCLSLQPNESSVEFECSLFNRGFEPLDAYPGLKLSGAESMWDGLAVSSRGLNFVCEADLADSASLADGVWRVASAPEWQLQPRQTRVFSGKVHVLFGGTPTMQGRGWSAYVEQNRLTISSSAIRSGKVLLQTEDGSTLESPISVSPQSRAEIDLSELSSRPIAVAIRDSESNLIGPRTLDDLPISHEQWRREPVVTYSRNEFPQVSPDSDPVWLERACGLVECRAVAYVSRAVQACRAGNFQLAADLLESALLYAADDPLAWWLRAVVLRLSGGDLDERPELLNAHYLSPQEPALRAEAFLSQPQTHGKERSPLLVALSVQPETFLDVACLLIDAGLFAEASRWIDEALRHDELQLLVVLQAFLLFEHSRMLAEASALVQRLERMPDLPPYPSRAVERTAAESLLISLPESARLAKLVHKARRHPIT